VVTAFQVKLSRGCEVTGLASLRAYFADSNGDVRPDMQPLCMMPNVTMISLQTLACGPVIHIMCMAV